MFNILSGTVVESDTPGSKCAFGATRLPGVGARRGVRPGTEATIESPRAPGPRRAAPASAQATHVARPQRFWADSYVGNSSIHAHEQRRRGHDTRTLHESGTVVEEIHLDVSAPSARQGSFLGAARGHRGGFHPRTQQRRRGRDTRTLHDSGTVVEDGTPGCKCAFGATKY